MSIDQIESNQIQPKKNKKAIKQSDHDRLEQIEENSDPQPLYIDTKAHTH